MAGKRMPIEAENIENTEDGEEVEIKEHRAMIYLPENAGEVKISAKVYMDGGIVNCYKVLTMDVIRDAFQRADDGYIDDEDTFVITEKGRAMLEEHM